MPSDLASLLEEGATLVVPSRQRAHAVRLAHAAAQIRAGRRVWSTPDVLPMEAWLQREAERLAASGGRSLPRLLSRAEEWLLWRECAAEVSEGLELLSRTAVADALQEASALAAEWGIDLSRRPLMMGTEAQLLFDAERAVAKRCSALRATRLQCISPALPPPGESRVMFRGFTAPSRRLQSLSAEACAPADLENQRGANARVTPCALLASDEIEELEQIAAWCRQRLDARPDARILIMLTGNPGSRERLATLIRQAIDPRAWVGGSADTGSSSGIEGLAVIEGGAPFSHAPVVAHALESLSCAAGARAEFSVLSEWLRAPFWTMPGEPERARIDLWLRESRQPGDGQPDCLAMLQHAPAPISAPAREVVTRVQRAAEILRAGRISPREWSERFHAALAAMGWPGNGRRDSREQQTLLRFQELLDEFGQLTATANALSQREAIRVFGELALATAFRAADDDAIVTISPRLGDPIVHYDAIWVAGLSAEVFPLPVQPDPFVPLGLQRAAGVPAASAPARLCEADTLLASWRAATDELVLSAPKRFQDLELLPSPLLAAWLTPPPPSSVHSAPAQSQLSAVAARSAISPTPAAASSSATASAKASLLVASPATLPRAPALSWLPAKLHRADQLEACSDSRGAVWPSGNSLPAGTRALELQNLCAFRAYAELRLGSAELRAPEPGISPDIRGRLMHAALESLWRELKDSQTLAQTSEPQLRQLIERSVTDAAALVLGPEAVRPEQRAAIVVREFERTVRIIQRLCELERTRAPFVAKSVELETQVTLAGARVSMRIDRVDALQSGGYAILDYKTGRHATAEWYDPRPSHPQLLAYLAAVGPDAVAMATVSLTARDVRYEGVGVSSQLLPKLKAVQGVSADQRGAWQLRVKQWRDCAERLAEEFVQGRAEVDPKPGACDYCHVCAFCRIADRGIFAIAEVRGDLPVLTDE